MVGVGLRVRMIEKATRVKKAVVQFGRVFYGGFPLAYISFGLTTLVPIEEPTGMPINLFAAKASSCGPKFVIAITVAPTGLGSFEGGAAVTETMAVLSG